MLPGFESHPAGKDNLHGLSGKAQQKQEKGDKQTSILHGAKSIQT
jgi:hypothetical protein